MITQKIDADDDILGVYHEWAREIAKSFDKLSVICLYQGKTDLPYDVRIFSLGKEKKQSKVLYIKKFFEYTCSLRNDYDVVFVHMNPVYIALGFVIWKALKKKVFLWYAHPARNFFTRVAYKLSDGVITSVPEAFYARSKKVMAIGHGIDVKRFSRCSDINRDERSILYFGRIAPPKKVDILLGGIKFLKDEGVSMSLDVVGDPPQIREGKNYLEMLREFVRHNNLLQEVSFYGAIPNNRASEAYNKHGIFVNLSPLGYFDKTVLEAMACECLVIASNEAYNNVFPRDLHDLLIFKQDDPKDLAYKIKRVLKLSSRERYIIGKRLRKVVEEKHSIFTLGKRLRLAFSRERSAKKLATHN